MDAPNQDATQADANLQRAALLMEAQDEIRLLRALIPKPPINESPRVFEVIELVEESSTTVREQSCFVMARSCEEACRIVGENERRAIQSVRELCPISQLPGNLFRVVLKETKP